MDIWLRSIVREAKTLIRTVRKQSCRNCYASAQMKVSKKSQTITLREHAYSNILKIAPPKTESFQIKILIFFLISAKNIDCGYSLEPPQRVPTIYVFKQK